MPPVPLRFLILFLVAVFFVTLVQVGILTVAFDKLGLSSDSAFLLFMTIIVGSMVNLPLFSVKSDPLKLEDLPPQLQEFYRMQPFTGRTMVTVNVGGCVVPVAFCLYLLGHHPLSTYHVAVAVAAISALSYAISRSLPGVGFGMPLFVAPLLAALLAVAFDPENAAPLAYVSGTLGVLIGADLLHLRDVRKIGAPVVSIGGAGTFDGIFLTGIVAALLA
jgi:uncharacterized membrane protein